MRQKRSGEWGVGNGDAEIISFSPLPTPHSLLLFRFLFAFCRLTFDVSASQGYWIEYHIIDVHRNVVQRNAGRERSADAPAALNSRFAHFRLTSPHCAA